ncbi:MAG: bifunctional N-acetylglucosamine-1-phosphate uridyltransferase/glucosamine-1-phosphate acetyltransferase, partial [Bacillota bacterium]
MKTAAIILAAGKGTRMKSSLPKVLHQVCGKAMVQIIIDNIEAAEIGKSYIVIGHGAEKVKEILGEAHQYAVQEPQLGTGHCVMQAVPAVPDDTDGVLVVCGDTPLLKAKTLAMLKDSFVQTGAACTILTAVMENPAGYGRIIRSEAGNIVAIVEEKDATAEQKKITEVNTGTYFFDYKALKEALANITNDNAQGEYYLTDTLSYLNAKGKSIAGIISDDTDETMGVNDRANLAKADRLLRLRKNNQLMAAGVTLIDPQATYIDLDVEIGQDTVIHPNCHLRGKTKIGCGCTLDADCQITDSIIG